jgi:hypothetical protein
LIKLFLGLFLFLNISFANTYSSKEYKILDVKNGGKIGYLKEEGFKVGESGVVLSTHSSHSIIIARAIITKVDGKYVTLKFTPLESLKQDAIASSNLKPQSGDIFVSNYLYTTSLLITPNLDSFLSVRNYLDKFNFIHPDLFAAHLKIIEEPTPTKKEFQEFAKAQNLGTILFVIEDNIYVVDTNSFKIIDTIILPTHIKDTTFISPFYTRVEKITRATFDFSAEKIENYTIYYKKLLGI